MADKRDIWRERKRAYRAKHFECMIRYSLKDGEAIKRKASAKNLTVQEYIKACVESYQDEKYIVPKNPVIQHLILQIRKVGNNINQLVRHIHTSKQISKSDIELLQNQLKKIDANVKEALYKPKKKE